jgi:NADPH2:quinone reductase
MKAWVATRLGEPRDVLELADVAPPQPGPGDVVLDVEAVGLNFLDAAMCRGTYLRQRPLPFVPGVEVVGRAPDGARVVALQPPDRPGVLTEQVAVPRDRVYPVPASLPVADAAAMLVTYQTAYFALHRRARLHGGETLLVHAGAGGLGTALLQLGGAIGARLLATAGSPEKLAVCRAEGAELAVGYEDFVQAVLDATGGEGADVICDSVGGDVFERSLECLAFEGRILPLGFSSGIVPRLSVAACAARTVTVVGLAWGAHYPARQREQVLAAHEALLRLHADGAVVPRVTTSAFQSAPEALQRLGDGETSGKLVVLA